MSARVAFSYDATHEDELSFKVGDVVTVLSRECEDAGWWMGEVDGRKGVFPDNFVELIPPPHPPPPVVAPKVLTKETTENLL